MTTNHPIAITCRHCGADFPMLTRILDENTFKNPQMFGNSANCPHCRATFPISIDDLKDTSK